MQPIDSVQERFNRLMDENIDPMYVIRRKLGLTKNGFADRLREWMLLKSESHHTYNNMIDLNIEILDYAWTQINNTIGDLEKCKDIERKIVLDTRLEKLIEYYSRSTLFENFLSYQQIRDIINETDACKDSKSSGSQARQEDPAAS